MVYEYEGVIPTSHFFVRVFDVFVEGIHAEEYLTAYIARHAVGVADQGGMLLQHSQVQLKFLKK